MAHLSVLWLEKMMIAVPVQGIQAFPVSIFPTSVSMGLCGIRRCSTLVSDRHGAALVTKAPPLVPYGQTGRYKLTLR